MISNMSATFYSVFLDFRNAFGTLPHNIMIKALEDIHLPQVYTDTIKDVYKSSFIQVICGLQLTEQIPLCLGIKTGCPWSAVNFILAINQWLVWMRQCTPSESISPNPVQAFADDVQMSSCQENIIHNMLCKTRRLPRVVGSRSKGVKMRSVLQKEERRKQVVPVKIRP